MMMVILPYSFSSDLVTVCQWNAVLAMIDLIRQHPFTLEWPRAALYLFYNFPICQRQDDSKTLTTVMFFTCCRHIFYVAKEAKLLVANKNSDGCFY
jgi:hypothetical protein